LPGSTEGEFNIHPKRERPGDVAQFAEKATGIKEFLTTVTSIASSGNCCIFK
jgi:hypothetical protein